MPAHENFETATDVSENFASAISGLKIRHNVIPSPGELKTLPDGSKVVQNANGDVIFVDYSEGSRIMRFKDYVVCKSNASDHWFRTSKFNWLRLD